MCVKVTLHSLPPCKTIFHIVVTLLCVYVGKRNDSLLALIIKCGVSENLTRELFFKITK